MDIAKHWRQKGARYRLEGQRHRTTGEVRFPARPAALGEAEDAWEMVQLKGTGEIYSFSVVRQAPSGFEELTPYPVALVRLDEGPLVTAQLTDFGPETPTIGQRVEMVTRRLMDSGEDGVLVYGYKFRPVLGVV